MYSSKRLARQLIEADKLDAELAREANTYMPPCPEGMFWDEWAEMQNLPAPVVKKLEPVVEEEWDGMF